MGCYGTKILVLFVPFILVLLLKENCIGFERYFLLHSFLGVQHMVMLRSL